jgi:hypothetical protein
MDISYECIQQASTDLNRIADAVERLAAGQQGRPCEVAGEPARWLAWNCSGPGTYGIVEFFDGHIEVRDVERIRFTDHAPEAKERIRPCEALGGIEGCEHARKLNGQLTDLEARLSRAQEQRNSWAMQVEKEHTRIAELETELAQAREPESVDIGYETTPGGAKSHVWLKSNNVNEYCDGLRAERDALRADNERLRGLVRAVDSQDPRASGFRCMLEKETYDTWRAVCEGDGE